MPALVPFPVKRTDLVKPTPPGCGKPLLSPSYRRNILAVRVWSTSDPSFALVLVNVQPLNLFLLESVTLFVLLGNKSDVANPYCDLCAPILQKVLHLQATDLESWN